MVWSLYRYVRWESLSCGNLACADLFSNAVSFPNINLTTPVIKGKHKPYPPPSVYVPSPTISLPWTRSWTNISPGHTHINEKCWPGEKRNCTVLVLQGGGGESDLFVSPCIGLLVNVVCLCLCTGITAGYIFVPGLVHRKRGIFRQRLVECECRASIRLLQKFKHVHNICKSFMQVYMTIFYCSKEQQLKKQQQFVSTIKQRE